MQTLYDAKTITDTDISNFSKVPAVQEIARNACRAVSKIFPIYVLTRVNPKTGTISDETDEVLSLYTRLAQAVPASSYDAYSQAVNIVLSVYHFDKDAYAKYTSNTAGSLRIFQHVCTDYNFKTACPNVVSKIRNACINDFIAQDTSSWMYFMEDDMLLSRVYDYVDDKPVVLKCDTWQSLLIAFAIWQNLTVTAPRSKMQTSTNAANVNATRSIPVGLSGFPGYNSSCYETQTYHENRGNNQILRLNTTRLTNCVLLRVRNMMSKYGIHYETDYDCWDDLDMNLQVAVKAQYNLLAVDYPICSTTNRPMVSNTSNIVYSTNKLNNYCAQMYYKWGNLISFRTWMNTEGKAYAINSKLPNDFTGLILADNWKPTYDEEVLKDLRALIADDSLLQTFIEKHCDRYFATCV